MTSFVDLFDNTYAKFKEDVLSEIRRETYGEDIGQSSWITTDEYDRFYAWLNLPPDAHILEVASGSGGPAIYLASKFGSRITGVDINEKGIRTARQSAADANLSRVHFQWADADKPLPFDDGIFDAVICADSINHFCDRPGFLQEWHRVLKPGRRIFFTDPVVLTGPVTNIELAARSSIGIFLFVPLETTKQFLAAAGFNLLHCEDVTANIELTSGRWHAAREKRESVLLGIEGHDRFDGLQYFLSAVHTLTRERRLSRFFFVAEKIIE
jgi:SAM-dependent methyltransferase